MIRLDIDLSYLAKHFEIGTQRVNQYGSMSIEEIMEAEAAQGNKKAENYKETVINTPSELIKLFKLASPKNRYAILSQMNSADLAYIANFLEPEDLQMGLMFFTKTKILNLIFDLPKSKICSIVFQAFSVEQFLRLIPEKELDRFFNSKKLDKNKILQYVKTLDADKLNKMYEKFMLREEGKVIKDSKLSQEQIAKWMEGLNPDKFKKSLQYFERDAKEGLIGFLVKKDKDLLTEFSKNALLHPLKRMDKVDIVKFMDKLEPQDLLKMVYQLPDELLAVVVTQIDAAVFAEVLSKNFQDVLAQIGVGCM